MTPTELSGRLSKGETVLWSGRPQQGVRLTARDALLIPFSLLWGGFAIFWETTVLSRNAPFFFRLWGVPFVLIGLYLIAGRFVLDAWVRNKTTYAVTDRRILIIRSGLFGNVTSLGLARLPAVQLREQGNGCGTIRFGGLSALYMGRGFGFWTPALDPTPQFIGIENAHRVYELIERASRDAA